MVSFDIRVRKEIRNPKDVRVTTSTIAPSVKFLYSYNSYFITITALLQCFIQVNLSILT